MARGGAGARARPRRCGSPSSSRSRCPYQTRQEGNGSHWTSSARAAERARRRGRRGAYDSGMSSSSRWRPRCSSSAQIPLATQVQLPTGETVELAADYVVYEPDQQSSPRAATPSCARASVLLRADEVTYNQRPQVATATGNVMFVSGLMAAVADEVTRGHPLHEANVKGGLFMQKRGVTPEALLAGARRRRSCAPLGETPVSLSGTRIRRTGPNGFVVDGLAFTPCECEPRRAHLARGGQAAPTWRWASAPRSPGRWCTCTRCRCSRCPGSTCPWPSGAPACSCRAPLLRPQRLRPRAAGLRHARAQLRPDLHPGLLLPGAAEETHTLDPAGGPSSPARAAPLRRPRPPAAHRVPLRAQRAHRGPRHAGPALRPPARARPASPASSSAGRRPQGLLVDEARGLRGEASWQHTQDLGGGFHDRVDASVRLGRLLHARPHRRHHRPREPVPAQHRRRSTTGGTTSYAGLDVALRQDLRWGYSFFSRQPGARGRRDPAQPIIPGPRTFQRLPALTFALPERPSARPADGRLPGGVHPPLAADLPLRRRGRGRPLQAEPPLVVSPPGPRSTPAGPDPGQRPLRRVRPRGARPAGPLPPAVRLLRAGPLRAADALRARAAPGRLPGRGRPGRCAARLPPAGPGAGLAGGPHLRAARGATLRHVSPRPWSCATCPRSGAGCPRRAPRRTARRSLYDELDAALPRSPDGRGARFLHAVVEVDQTLRSRTADGGSEPLRLTLGQGFDLSRYAPRARDASVRPLRDTFARLTATWASLSGWAAALGPATPGSRPAQRGLEHRQWARPGPLRPLRRPAWRGIAIGLRRGPGYPGRSPR